ncbi:MAG: Secreted protein [uncultured Aureispira sp.]|uniref:Secreted protein n=1 Tax=uncultured Aureispira sp. TaxID=1331704 RepID=A0A6S6TDR3_9BACT|nr:MAG: Secreted protein [uncultured Aureispira sp.]
MKQLATLFAACLMAATTVHAQTCCTPNTIAPEITTGFHTTQIGGNVNTPIATLGTINSADLPTVEYIITKRNSPALDDMGVPDTVGGGGDVIIGADVDGIFMPDNIQRYGVTLNPGDTFDLVAVGYDLAVIQNLADSLLNGTSPSGPCCGLFGVMSIVLGEPAIAGFCDSMNRAGIYNSTHINGMNEVLTIFDVFSGGQTSLPSFINTLNLINSNGTFISQECGGTGADNFLSFGINTSATYGYDREGTIAVQKLSDVSLFMLYPNPATKGVVNIHFTTQKEVDLNINLFDALGQRVHHQTLGNVSGDFNTAIPVSQLAAGIYYVELTDGHNKQVLKVIVD